MAYPVTQKFKDALAADERHWVDEVVFTNRLGYTETFNGSAITQGGVQIEDAVSSQTSLSVGGAVVKKATVSLLNYDNHLANLGFDGSKIKIRSGLKYADGSIEYVKKGTYYTDSASYNGYAVTLTAYDAMSLFDRPYSDSALTYPASLSAIVADLCTTCGVQLRSTTFPQSSYVVDTRPDDTSLTCRQVLKWAAEIAGCFARIDADDFLYFDWFDVSNPNQTLSNFYSNRFGLRTTTITGVILEADAIDAETGETYPDVYFSGSTTYPIKVSGNKLINPGSGQTVCNAIAARVSGLSYTDADLTHGSDPSIEAGDVATCTDALGNQYKILITSTTFSTGSAQHTVSAAASPQAMRDVRRSEPERLYDAEKAIADIRKKIEEGGTGGGGGLYPTLTTESGNAVLWLHDKKVLADSDLKIKIDRDAVRVTEDGGTTWNFTLSPYIRRIATSTLLRYTHLIPYFPMIFQKAIYFATQSNAAGGEKNLFSIEAKANASTEGAPIRHLDLTMLTGATDFDCYEYDAAYAGTTKRVMSYRQSQCDDDIVEGSESLSKRAGYFNMYKPIDMHDNSIRNPCWYDELTDKTVYGVTDTINLAAADGGTYSLYFRRGVLIKATHS